MRIKIFSIPLVGGGQLASEMNAFEPRFCHFVPDAVYAGPTGRDLCTERCSMLRYNSPTGRIEPKSILELGMTGITA